MISWAATGHEACSIQGTRISARLDEGERVASSTGRVARWSCLGLALASMFAFGCAASADPGSVADPPAVASKVALRSSSDPSAPTPVTASETEGADCTGRAAQPLDRTWTVAVGNTLRTFLVHVPRSYDPRLAVPVVLNFHGLGSDGAAQDELSGMSAKADVEGFIAVHPEGLGAEQSWNAGDCCGYAHEANVDDIGFVTAMLDELELQLCVDTGRVFVTGMSNGALFAERVGCELASRVAAIAPVAGVLVEPVCVPARPMPVMEFHGTADRLLPYQGDWKTGLPSAPANSAAWASRDGCVDALTQTYDDRDSVCETFEQCAGGADVTLCTIRGGGHTWPGGEPLPWLGYTTPYLSATDAMWTFFQAHPM
jgi:polyhydroxybutyrate depolymerase